MAWTHVGDRTSKSRKARQCYLCATEIAKGEMYICRFGYTDDGPESFSFHVHCEAMTESWDATDWETATAGCLTKQEIDAWLNP